jgi:hypothetical protein
MRVLRLRWFVWSLVAAGVVGIAVPRSRAQHAGGHGGGFGMGGHVASGQAPVHQGHPNGVGHHGLNGTGFGFSSWGGYGYGWGGPYGYGVFGSVGMSPFDQEVVRQAQVGMMTSQIWRNQMEAQNAYAQALRAEQEAQYLARKNREPVSDDSKPAADRRPLTDRRAILDSLLELNTVRWPRGSERNRTLIQKRAGADKAVLAVHRQVHVQGHAQPETVTEAKEKIRDFRDAARKQFSRGSNHLRNIESFVRKLDVALDESLDATHEGRTRLVDSGP